MKVLIPGHIGKSPKDSGAVSPAGWLEAIFVSGVCCVVARRWGDAQVPYIVDACGSYTERGKRADSAKAELVVHVHADASPAEVGPDFSAVYYWPGSAVGQLAAERVAQALGTAMPWQVKVVEAVSSAAWMKNVRALLSASKAPAIVVELGFTDGVQGRAWLPQNREACGAALARALEAPLV